MTETATLGGGCFWCLEAVYQRMKGVTRVRSGYMGGAVENPSYEQVCSGRSGHVEVVQLEFDPETAGFGDILDVFFAIHDPTTLNRQGNDVGPQYRSVIFYHSDEQRRMAENRIAEIAAAGTWRDPVVTAVEPASRFWEAEAYHQDYYRNHASQPYCAYVVAPKVDKFNKKFAKKVRAEN
jgi:peptide-methionine (S)-S-oxide reductase